MRKIAGTPLWLDLGNDQPRKAQEFYSALFGWEFEDRGEEFHHYHLIKHNGGYAGGLMYSKTSPEGGLEQAPYPNHWAVYLGTHDIDDVVAQVSEHNGTPIFGPVRVGEVGTMALVKDPAGAELGFWQPGTMHGQARHAGLV